MTRLEEIKIKEARVRGLMKKLNLKGLLFKTQANFCWLTAGGLNEVTVADTLGVTSLLITEKERFVLSNRIETPRMMEDEGLAELGFKLVQFEWYDGDENKEVARILDPAQVGCDAPGFGYACLARETTELRYSLVAGEIERYVWMGKKASMAVETVLSGARPGMKECALIGEVLRILWYDRIDSICNQAAADERSRKYRHGIPTEKIVGKYCMLNVNARKWGLVTTITRAVHFGPMSASFRKQVEDTIWIENSMIAASKPGAAMKDIFTRTKQLYAEKGLPDEWTLHHQGGAQGYRNRDYLMFPNSAEKIVEDQCICWNPTIAGPDYGTKSEDAFIARNNGPLFVTVPVIFPTLSMKLGGIDFVRPTVLELSMNRKLKLGVVGLGFGANFLPVITAHPQAELYAICRRDPAGLRGLAERYQVPRPCSGYADMLAIKELDAVLIMSPVSEHFGMTRQALQAGKHVACTVPMAGTVEECLELAALRAETGLVYMMFETAVYTRTFLYVRELRDGGRLGRIQFLRGSHQQNMSMPGWPDYWYGYPPMLYATHALAPMLALAGQPVESVVCHGSGTIRPEYAAKYGSPFAVETAHLKLADSDLVCEATRSLFDTIRQFRESFDVYASKLSFEWEQIAGEGPVVFSGLEDAERVAIPDYGRLLPEGLRSFTGGQVHDAAHASSVQGGGHGGSYPHLVHEFASAILEGRPSAIDADAAANWSMAGMCAHQSAMQGGKRVSVPETRA